MGLFGKKSKIGEPAGGTVDLSHLRTALQVPAANSASTVGWILRGGSAVAFEADPAWSDTIRTTVPKIARVGHPVAVNLRRSGDGRVHVWHEGVIVGSMSTGDSRAYGSAFSALERAKRHGVVDARIEPREWKSGGSCFLDIAAPQRPCIPFNQPPQGIARAGRADFEVKDEAQFKDYIVRIARNMQASPGFFVIAPPDESGLHPVFAPMDGVTAPASQVGFVNKAGTRAATAATLNGPVYLPGMVWWSDSTPQVELASWLG